MEKIFVVRDSNTGGLIRGFRNQGKADSFAEFNGNSFVVDEVALDEELPEQEMGVPVNVRVLLNLAVVVPLAAVFQEGEGFGPDHGAGRARLSAVSWISSILEESGARLEAVDHAGVQVTDDAGHVVYKEGTDAS